MPGAGLITPHHNGIGGNDGGIGGPAAKHYVSPRAESFDEGLYSGCSYDVGTTVKGTFIDAWSRLKGEDIPGQIPLL